MGVAAKGTKTHKNFLRKSFMSDEAVKNDAVEPLCEGCDETFSEFLNEMAEQNAKVATCPKCGKIHAFGKTNGTKPDAVHQPVKKVS